MCGNEDTFIELGDMVQEVYALWSSSWRSFTLQVSKIALDAFVQATSPSAYHQLRETGMLRTQWISSALDGYMTMKVCLSIDHSQSYVCVDVYILDTFIL